MLKLIYHDWDNGLHPNFIRDPELVLDCGFGSGNWAYDLAEYDSNCTVSGAFAIPMNDTQGWPGCWSRHLPLDGSPGPVG